MNDIVHTGLLFMDAFGLMSLINSVENTGAAQFCVLSDRVYTNDWPTAEMGHEFRRFSTDSRITGVMVLANKISIINVNTIITDVNTIYGTSASDMVLIASTQDGTTGGVNHVFQTFISGNDVVLCGYNEASANKNAYLYYLVFLILWH